MSSKLGLRVATVTILLIAASMLNLGAASAKVSLGHVSAPDRVLRESCHNYRYHYALADQIDDFVLETFLVDSRNRKVGSGAFVAPFDPSTGTGRFRLCGSDTKPGKFTIKSKLTYYDGYAESITRLKPTTFRLLRAA